MYKRQAIDQSSRHPGEVTAAVRNTLAPIRPSVQQLWHRSQRNSPYVEPAQLDANAVGRAHLAATVNELIRNSAAISEAVDSGALGIVGCQYRLTEGRAVPYIAVGRLNIELTELS